MSTISRLLAAALVALSLFGGAPGARADGITNPASTAAPSGAAGGDLTGTYPNPTLAAIISAGGPTGSATVTPVVTYDAKGRLTAVTSATIAPPFSAVTGQATLAQLPTLAANTMLGNWTGSSAVPAANAMPSCPDSGGNHLNYVSGTGITCGTGIGSGITALTGDVTASGPGSVAATLATAQPGAHTWAAVQTFTLAPVFTDPSGARSALGLGTAATQNTGTSGANLPFLNGGNTWSADQTFSNQILGATQALTQSGTTTTLNGGINNSVTSLTLASSTGFPSAGVLSINGELMTYSAIAGNVVTITTRGAYGTTAASHSNGDQVQFARFLTSASTSVRPQFWVGSGGAIGSFTGRGNIAFSPFVTNMALRSCTTCIEIIAMGYDAAANIVSGTGGVYLGTNAGVNLNAGAAGNVIIGGANVMGSGAASSSVIIGYRNNALAITANLNVLVGFNTGSNLTSGPGNIGLGPGLNFPSATATGQLNIGNLIQGTGVYQPGANSAVLVTTGTIQLGGTAVTIPVGSIAAFSGTSIPAGGAAGQCFLLFSTTNFGVCGGSGVPTLSAAKGSIYIRSDGTTTTDRVFVNTDGGTTWTAILTVL